MPITTKGYVEPATPGEKAAADFAETELRRLESPVPATRPRLFQLVREVDVTGISGTGLVAWGVQFPDGKVCTRWNGEIAQTCVWDSIEQVEAIHGHSGSTSVVWLD